MKSKKLPIATQPVNTAHVAALTYIDTLGGKEFMARDVADSTLFPLFRDRHRTITWAMLTRRLRGIEAPKDNGKPRADQLNQIYIACGNACQEVMMAGHERTILHMLGVPDPINPELPILLPKGRKFLTFSRNCDYYNDLFHVDSAYANDEQKRLHADREYYFAHIAWREAEVEAQSWTMEEFEKAWEATPTITLAHFCASVGIRMLGPWDNNALEQAT